MSSAVQTRESVFVTGLTEGNGYVHTTRRSSAFTGAR